LVPEQQQLKQRSFQNLPDLNKAKQSLSVLIRLLDHYNRYVLAQALLDAMYVEASKAKSSLGTEQDSHDSRWGFIAMIWSQPIRFLLPLFSVILIK
jgi:hypothetical protein